MSAPGYTTMAAFVVKGDHWTWIRWTHHTANSHSAIIAKARELSAKAWDFGQAEHHETSKYPRSR